MAFVEVWELARECGVKSNDVLAAAKRLGMPVVRVGSKLNDQQAKRLRADFAGRAPQQCGRQVMPASSPAAEPATDTPTVRPRRPQELRMFDVPAGPRVPRGCACCGMRFLQAATQLTADRYCPACRDHYSTDGETDERLIARLQDHDCRLRKGYAAAWHCQADYEGRMKRALRSRDNWRRILVRLLMEHEAADDGSCRECAVSFPCPTWRRLEELNVGVHRQVERFAAMTEEQLHKALDDEAD